MSNNIDKSKAITTDIYGINSYVNEIKKQFTPGVNEDTLLLGIFGYYGQVFSDLIQNTVVMASEFSNESIPTKAKFEKNIISHALGLGINDINAVPSTFDILLTFVEDDIEKWYSSIKYTDKKELDGEEFPWEFTFDKDIPIYIGEYEFHADYDIIIRKIKLTNAGKKSKFTYTAKYLIDIDNPVSDISNPYLTPPVRMRVNGKNILFTKCTLRQVEKQSIYRKVLSDNSISSKTVTFEFDGQLASFTADVKEGDKTTHLIPVYEGLNVEQQKYPYFYYSYLDSNTIRIKFDRVSYAPRINSDVTINLQTTQGEGGNFTYDPSLYPSVTAESTKYGYNNITCEIRPITGEAYGGTDKKSIEDLQKLIPKEALSRGSITNIADLNNFFNMLNNENSMLYFYKKRDNALERLYHSFIVMRDMLNVIIPTNTIDIEIDKEEVDESMKQVVKKGTIFKLVGNRGIKSSIEDIEKINTISSDDANKFGYVIPYNFTINMSPLYSMYFLTTIDTDKFLDFSYINEECMYQYIATSIHWHRGYAIDSNKYSLYINMQQNITPLNDISIDDEFDHCIRCIAVLYDENDNPLRWAEGKKVENIEEPNISAYGYEFEFISNDDHIDIKNRIRINSGLYDIDSINESPADLTSNTKCVIHVISKQDNTGNSYGLNELDKIIPGLDGFSLSNSYTVLDGLDFFYDYSDIVSSTVTVKKDDETGKETFTVQDVPVVKYDYFDNEDKAIEFSNELLKRKNYIDYAIKVLEDAFGIDFKFFNTYGPSKLFTTDNIDTYLDKTSLSLTFRLKLKANYDTNIINDIIQEIKIYVEDINNIATIHMPNLVAHIIKNYSESIEFFEFLDMNGHGPGNQHIYAMEMPNEIIIPEFVNIASRKDGTPDIEIILV